MITPDLIVIDIYGMSKEYGGEFSIERGNENWILVYY
jgi:hypothetical protein